MAHTLKRFHPHLFIETHSRELQDQVEKITKQEGYSMHLEMPSPREVRSLPFNAFYFSVNSGSGKVAE